jgi:lipoprotein-anchoring transpeptidase ErfK/SrfK
MPRRCTLRTLIGALVVGALLAGAPAARAQEAGPLFFPATGHTLADDAGFLSYWQAHNGERLLGLPVSEALSSESGATQYFERGRLEQRIDPTTGVSSVQPGAVAKEYTDALYRTFAPAPPRPQQFGVRVFAETDHTLREPFLTFWQANGGVAFFGPPISEPLWEQTSAGRRQVQYFANVRLERDTSLAGTAGEIQVGALGRSLAALRSVDTGPIENPGYATAGPEAPLADDIAQIDTPTRSAAPVAAPAEPAAPKPAEPAAPSKPKPAAQQPAAPRRVASGGAKHIMVDLSKQWMYAYEGDSIVFDAPVATGRDGMETPTGDFAIYAKLKVQTMDGVLDGKYWVVPNVPNVMYIHGGVALHGTYWHNLFGTGARPSHGCVNLPLRAAEWLYNWAPMGTPVHVTY